MAGIQLRTFSRIVARVLMWLVGAALLLIAAWVMSNLRDIDPVPRPAALALPAPTLTEEGNAFFALVGLHAQADRDAAVVGRTLWRLRQAAPIASRGTPDAKASEAIQRAERESLGVSLPQLQIVLCDPSQANCIAKWLAQTDTLAAQRQGHVAFGERCESLLGQHFEFEEMLPAELLAGGPIPAHIGAASQCSQWLLSGAVVEWTRHRSLQSVALLAQADRLNRALLAGSQTLIAQMVALRVTRNTLNAITSLSLRDPAMAIALAPLLAPWPDSVQAVRRWMVTEAAFQHGTLTDVLPACLSFADVIGDHQQSWWEGLKDKFRALACRHNVGLHPQRTLAALDQRWLNRLAALDGGLATAAANEKLAADQRIAESAGILGMLTWRNTMGSIVINVAQSAYGVYLARQADAELHREAALLALRAASIAPSERAAWMTKQEQSAVAQGRLGWNATGQTLSARTWQQDYAGPSGFNAERDAIRITWPTP